MSTEMYAEIQTRPLQGSIILGIQANIDKRQEADTNIHT